MTSSSYATDRSGTRPLCVALAACAFIAALTLPAAARAATYYVSPQGDDKAAGTKSAPFASWARAQSAAAPNDTVYFRGGRYLYKEATSVCTSPTARISAVVLNKSGAAGKPIRYWAYPGERPIFDFSAIGDTTRYACRQIGVRVEASWLHLKGLEITGVLQLNDLNHESWGLYVLGGSYDVFEQLDSHHNMGPGFFLQRGGHNLFLNSDSHENEDMLASNGDGQSADGFGCHPDRAGDTGNVFHGCRAWWNSDDNWDFINSQEACTVEYSWAWYAGYKPDAISHAKPVPLAAGNGNGFKAGGYGDPQAHVPAVPPQHVVRFNAAFYNKANGLYANHEIVSPIFYDNTLFNNGTGVDMLGLDGTTVTSVGLLRNNLTYSNDGRRLVGDMDHGGPIDDRYDSWDPSMKLTVTDADFRSVDFSPPASCPEPFRPGGTPCVASTDTKTFGGMASARQADGSLPDVPFLRLAKASKLMDRGVDVGLPYKGAAPDLGCFEASLAYDPAEDGASLGETSSDEGRDAGAVSRDAQSAGGPPNADPSPGGGAGADAGGGGCATTGRGDSRCGGALLVLCALVTARRRRRDERGHTNENES